MKRLSSVLRQTNPDDPEASHRIESMETALLQGLLVDQEAEVAVVVAGQGVGTAQDLAVLSGVSLEDPSPAPQEDHILGHQDVLSPDLQDDQDQGAESLIHVLVHAQIEAPMAGHQEDQSHVKNRVQPLDQSQGRAQTTGRTELPNK